MLSSVYVKSLGAATRRQSCTVEGLGLLSEKPCRDRLDNGDRDLSLNWDLQFPELGNAVEIVTQYIRVVVWLNHESYLEVSQPLYM